MKAEEFYSSQLHDATSVVGRLEKSEVIDLMEAYADQYCSETLVENTALEDMLDDKAKQIKELKELLQYVANEHLCGTKLIEDMKKQGIEYNKPDKH